MWEQPVTGHPDSRRGLSPFSTHNHGAFCNGNGFYQTLPSTFFLLLSVLWLSEPCRVGRGIRDVQPHPGTPSPPSLPREE